MNVPDKALEAAARSLVPALGDDTPRELSDIVVRLLEASAPFIAAQAIRDEAALWLSMPDHESYTNEDVGNYLEVRADELDGQ